MDPFSGAAFAGLGVMFLLAAVLPLLLMGVALLYVGLRIRDAKADVPDPELGLKTAYWFLYSLGILILHFGLTVLVSHWFQLASGPDPVNPMMRAGPGRVGVPVGMPAADDWKPATRIGAAFVVAGGLITGVFFLIGSLGTRDREWPTVRRVFVGARLVLAGLFSVVAFLILVVLQFQKDAPTGGLFESILAMLAVWVPSLAVHIFLFRMGGTPGYYVPPVVRPRQKSTRRPVIEPEPDAEANEVLPDDEPPRRRRSDDETEELRRPDDEDEQPRRRRPRDDD